MNLDELDALKAKLDALRPLPAAALRNLHDELVLRWTYNSNAIEGNTLTLMETKVVLEGITVGGKLLREHFEAINHRDAILYVEDVVRKAEPLSEWQIRNLHRLVLKLIDDDNAGTYRKLNVMLDVPGFLNVSLLALWESNAPYNDYSQTSTPRYRYRTHPMLSAAWGIPFSVGIPLSFEGYADFIGSKGKDEFGGDTKAETNIDMEIMYDISGAVGTPKNTFKIGVEYQYWKNKFGNNDATNPGATAKTPMVRAEYHF